MPGIPLLERREGRRVFGLEKDAAMNTNRTMGGLRRFVASTLVCMVAGGVPATATADPLIDQETRIGLAKASHGVTGAGVLVAIMDRGIDWRHEDFRNADGTTRIEYIFDLTDDAGAAAPGNTWGKGTVYTKAQINAALTGGPVLATRDAVGHGTTTAGLCCGNGRASGGLYKGAAENAGLIVIKITSDGAPAHDTQPAEAAFWDATRVPIAIDFATAKATELGKPLVMLLNVGTTGGPADGTSTLAKKVDATVGPGIPGRLFITGAGDDGGQPNHANGTVTQGGVADLVVRKGTAGGAQLLVDFWYSGADRFDVTVTTPSGSSARLLPPATNADYTRKAAPISIITTMGRRVGRHPMANVACMSSQRRSGRLHASVFGSHGPADRSTPHSIRQRLGDVSAPTASCPSPSSTGRSGTWRPPATTSPRIPTCGGRAGRISTGFADLHRTGRPGRTLGVLVSGADMGWRQGVDFCRAGRSRDRHLRPDLVLGDFSRKSRPGWQWKVWRCRGSECGNAHLDRRPRVDAREESRRSMRRRPSRHCRIPRGGTRSRGTCPGSRLGIRKARRKGSTRSSGPPLACILSTRRQVETGDRAGGELQPPGQHPLRHALHLRRRGGAAVGC